jgi:hypothetical protein
MHVPAYSSQVRLHVRKPEVGSSRSTQKVLTSTASSTRRQVGYSNVGTNHYCVLPIYQPLMFTGRARFPRRWATLWFRMLSGALFQILQVPITRLACVILVL